MSDDRTPARRPDRRQRHLLDPHDLRPPQVRPGTEMSLDAVQKWVLSAITVILVMALAGGASLIGYVAEPDRLDARIGANVIAGLIGMAGVVAGRLIHGWHPVSAWVLLGALPGVVGAAFTFGWV